MLQEQDSSHYRAPMNPAFVRRVLERRKAEEAAKRKALAEESKRRAKEILAAAAQVRNDLKKQRAEDEAKRLSGKPTMKEIIANVASLHGLTARDITGPSRFKHIFQARVETILTIRKLRPDLSTTHIGQALNRDHTSILNVVHKYGEGRKQFRKAGAS